MLTAGASMDSAKNLQNVFKLIFRDCLQDTVWMENSNPGEINVGSDGENQDKRLNNFQNVLNSIELLLRIFQKNYENRFRALIDYIFSQIVNLVEFYVSSNILNDNSLNQFLGIITLIMNIGITNSSDDIIEKIKDFYLMNIHQIKLKQAEDFDNSSFLPEELTVRLRILSVIYEVISTENEKEFQCHRDRGIFKNLVQCMNSEEECRFFSTLVTSNFEIVAAETLLNVIPKYIQVSKSTRILEYIWSEISKSLADHNNSSKSLRVYIVMCYLSNLYFSVDNKHGVSKIFNNKNYWILLQKGCTNVDFSVRKQALYLMKMSLEYLMENDLNVCCFNEESESSGTSNFEKPLMFWESNAKSSCINDFKEFCMIIEYLEEKQVHLIMPVLSLIEKFIIKNNQSTSKLHISWLIIVFVRILSHESIKVVKWGISQLLKISVDTYVNEKIMADVIKLLISTLNCTQLYFTDCTTTLEELINYFQNCSHAKKSDLFFKLVIKEICDIQWSSEALFFTIYALSFASKKGVWKKQEVTDIKKLVTCGTANHYTYIKSGMQCQLLKASTNSIDTDSVSVEEIFDYLLCFDSRLSLQRNSKVWEFVAKWISESYSSADVEDLIVKICRGTGDAENIGKMIVLFFDAYSLKRGKITELLKMISTSFADVHTRPYCNLQVQDFYLKVIQEIINMENTSLTQIFDPSLLDIFCYIKLRLNSAQDFESSWQYLKLLNSLLNHDKNRKLWTAVDNWSEKVVENMMSDPTPVLKFVQVKVLNILARYLGWNASRRKFRHLLLYLKVNLNLPLTKPDEDNHSFWGRMNCEYLAENWQLLAEFVGPDETPSSALDVSDTEFLKLCKEAVDLAGYQVLKPIMATIGKGIVSYSVISSFERTVDLIWNAIAERKKNDDHHFLIEIFVEFLFSQEVVETRNKSVRIILLNFCQRIFSEGITYTVSVFMKRIQNLRLKEESIYLFLDVLTRALLFGQVLRKDERLGIDVCSKIKETNLTPLINNCAISNEIRARGLQILLTLNPSDQVHQKFASALIESLIDEEKKLTKNRTRYFSDSHVHRVKQRLMQSLLILQSYITKEDLFKLWKWSANILITENNQPSVRYLQEWLMLRIIHRHPGMREEIWSYFQLELDKRPGSLCSFISIVYHIVKFIPSGLIASWIDEAVQTFLPYCMAQHFSVRLYAQVTLQKLLDLASYLKLTDLVQKYSVVKKSLNRSIETGNATKNCAKLQEDFYFTAFDPIRHFSLGVIFRELPRLTNVAPDEWIPEDLLIVCGILPEGRIPLRSEDESLKICQASKWMADGGKQDNVADDEDVSQAEPEASNFQKKIIPIKTLVPSWEALYDSSVYSSREKSKRDGLLVVASLVDRLPNLGGLSRTCEIFGASELVISSLIYTQDKQFQSLSVTAEKWIRVSEVKPFHLMDYLHKMKREGYTLLAAEQTTNSRPLQSVKFPKKSLLLLGNEKKGIPPQLLPLMDICIEIPQMGVIRSLNVHVTGALFVWEYAKQHMLLG